LRGITKFILSQFALLIAVSADAADATFRVSPDDLSRDLMKQVQAVGLTVPGAPEIPAFQWRLEYKRPLRKSREIQEHYAGSRAGPLSGLSATYRYDYPLQGEQNSDAVSIRGLVRVSPDDKSIPAKVEGLRFPLEVQAVFKVHVKESGADVAQECQVLNVVSASVLFASLKGEAVHIECKGKGKYKGFEVTMHSTLYFIQALGVFFNAQDLIDSPLGKFKSTTRILDVRVAS
jgi:hypothetical protein